MDKARVKVAGGRGGKGSLSQEVIPGGGRGKRFTRKDGGHGGNGGSVILVADDREQGLLASWSQRHHATAEHGRQGHGQNMNGRNGKNTICMQSGIRRNPLDRSIQVPNNGSYYRNQQKPPAKLEMGITFSTVVSGALLNDKTASNM